MSVNRFLKYLVTEKGRIFTMNCVGVTGVGMFCINYVPNTLLVDRFKSILQAYK